MTITFKQTCDKPYLRHHYKLVYTNGNKVIFDNYEDLQLTWFQTPNQLLDYVEILDIKEKGKGFK